jgi:cytochrome P450
MKPLSAMPGPASLPLVGHHWNLLRFARDPVGYADELSAFGNVAIFTRGMKGGIFRPQSDDVPAVVLAYGPEILGRVFNSAHAQFRSIHISAPPSASFTKLTWSLQRMHGTEHRKHRKLIMPAFHGKRLDSYRDVLIESAERAMFSWKEGEEIDVVAEARRILLVFVNRAFLGLDDEDGALSMGARLESVWNSLMSIFVRLPLDVPLSPRRRAIERADRLSVALEDLIARRRAMPVSSTKHEDMLSMLLAAHDEGGVGLTKDELLGHMSFLIFGGFESTIHAVAFAMYLLAQHPEVAASLHDEVTAVLGGHAPTVEQFAKLPVLDRVVKESLRLLSPVPFLLRTIEEPSEVGDYELPPRTELILSLYHTHRMPETFPQPNRFVPDRWIGFEPTTSQYMPFGVGPHMCAGWSLALMEMKVLLSMFIQRHRFELPKATRLDRHLQATLGPRGGMRMRLRPQDREFAKSPGAISGQLARMVELPQA